MNSTIADKITEYLPQQFVMKVKYFISEELLPAKRFAATGFGEFQPIDKGENEKALARNRRIEIKLTER